VKSVAAADTAVIYMGAGHAQAISAALIAAGLSRDLPVLVVESASLPESRRIALTLGELPEIARYGVSGPAVILLGRALAAAQSASTERDAELHYAHA